MAVNDLAAALAKAQLKIKSAEKDAANTHFRSEYATLQSVWEACRTALAENGLCVTQTIERDEKGYFLKTTLLHTSGQFMESSCPLLMGAKQDMQALGSAITYARRYGLAGLVGVVQKDDDANDASELETHSQPKFSPPTTSSKPPPASTPTPIGARVGGVKGVITEPQRKRLYAMSKAAQWEDEQMKSLLKVFGYGQSSEVQVKDYEEICNCVEKGPAFLSDMTM